MRHPFAGIIGPDQKPADQPEIQTTRRSLFGLVAGAVAAGTVGLLALGTTAAEAQRVTTLALGEEGGGRPGRPSTRMLGEEGGGRPPRRGWKK
jgi:hypothetical protein